MKRLMIIIIKFLIGSPSGIHLTVFAHFQNLGLLMLIDNRRRFFSYFILVLILNRTMLRR